MSEKKNQDLNSNPKKGQIDQTNSSDKSKNIENTNKKQKLLQKPPPFWDKPANVEKIKRMNQQFILYQNDDDKRNQKNSYSKDSNKLIFH